MNLKRSIFVFCFFVQVIGSLSLFADEWPQWRGLNRDGEWNENGVVSSFDGYRLKIDWRAPVAAGYSSPTVTDKYVYITDRLTEPDMERVHCFDVDTGEQIWSHGYNCEYSGIGYPVGPRVSVLAEYTRAYSLGSMGDLYCFDAQTGKILWHRDLRTEYRIKMLEWGVAAAPLIENELIILLIGGRNGACFIALDKVTGKEVWRSLDDDGSYSAPIVITQAGQRVLVGWTGDRIVGLDPKTGRLHWEYPMPHSRMVINIATPVFSRPYLFVSSFYDGSLMLKLDEKKLAAEKVWRRIGQSERATESLHCCISTPLILDRFIYGVDSYGELRCLDLETGDRIWEDLTAVPKARWANIHMVQNKTLTWMFNELGDLIIGGLSQRGFDEIGRINIISPTPLHHHPRKGVCWAHPAFAHRHIYVRNDEELVSIDLSAASR